MTTRLAPGDLVVSDGRKFLGAMRVSTPKRFEAVDAAGRRLGTFRTVAEAREALVAKQGERNAL